MFRKICLWGLWISTIIVLLLVAEQGLSGHWVTFYLLWPGGPTLGNGFLNAMTVLGSYHRAIGFAIGAIAVLILFFAFFAKTSIYVRVLAILGFAMTVVTAAGGYVYVTSGFQDRWSLGQMADAFVAVFGLYFIQLFFMNKTPRFPWNREKTS